MTNIFNCMDVTYSSNKVALKSINCSSFCFINKNVSTESMTKALFWTFYLTICLFPGFCQNCGDKLQDFCSIKCIIRQIFLHSSSFQHYIPATF